MNSPFIPELYMDQFVKALDESIMSRLFHPLVKRTVRERLFSRPWRPLRKYKLGEIPAFTTPGMDRVIIRNRPTI